MDSQETPIGRPRRSRPGRNSRLDRRGGRSDRIGARNRPARGSVVRPWMAAALLLLLAETFGGLATILFVCLAAWLVAAELVGPDADRRGRGGGIGRGGIGRGGPEPDPPTRA